MDELRDERDNEAVEYERLADWADHERKRRLEDGDPAEWARRRAVWQRVMGDIDEHGNVR